MRDRDQSDLYRTVRAAIIDWEAQYDGKKYRGKIPDGAIFSSRERADMTMIICAKLREMAEMPEQKKSPARIGSGGAGTVTEDGNGRR